jgi:hypothetical protein
MEPVTIRDVVMMFIGEASMCWEHVEQAGVFESERATDVGERLLEALGLDGSKRLDDVPI